MRLADLSCVTFSRFPAEPHVQGGSVMRPLQEFIRNEDGQDMVEYALLASLVAVASVAALKTLGPKIAAFYNRVGNEL
jgi:pilus assembly protein Flp/PilA